MTRVFEWLLAHRLIGVAAVLVLTGVFGMLAARVRPNYQIEDLFPVWDPARTTYDRFKAQFPYEDNRALVMVEADDLYTPAGLKRIAALEEAFRVVPNVLDVEGPLSTNDVVSVDDWVAIEPLFPSTDLSPEDLARRKLVATTDPLFAWSLASPDGKVVTIRVTLTPAAGADDAARDRFLVDARALVAGHRHDGQRIVLSGIPIVRAKYTELIQTDSVRLVPAALLTVLLLLFVAFRSPGAVIAGFATIVTAVVWSYGVMGLLGYSLTVLGAVMPIVVMIISISDTVHVVNDFTALRRAGHDTRAALAEAMSHTAIPCLLTEIVLACGFFSLIAVNITALYQFGVATGFAMLLTWLANMTVLPLALSLTRGGVKLSGSATSPVRAPWAVRTFGRFVDWIQVMVVRRPRRIVLVAVALLAGAAFAGTRVEVQSYAFDSLRPDLELQQDIRFAERAHGGLVPIAVFIEAAADEKGEAPAFDPRLLRLADRAAAYLESFPEIAQAGSLADPLRKAHGILAAGNPDALGDGLPGTRSLVAQEVSVVDDGKMLRDTVSFDRRSLVAMGYAKDVGSQRVEAMFHEIDAWVEAEQAKLDAAPDGPRAHISTTGQLRIFKDVNDTLLRGLAGSLGGALLVTVIMFCFVLRSWKLGLIGIIPNVAPLTMVFGMMWIAGITLKPETVMTFSVTLVIADDDTIQFLARFRGHYLRAVERARSEPGLDVHQTASLACMRDVGLPMFVTSTSVSVGFLLLLFSQLTGSAHVGLIIGTTLFAAVFADMFLTPLLLMKLRPRLK